jgi:hypothetical protein
MMDNTNPFDRTAALPEPSADRQSASTTAPEPEAAVQPGNGAVPTAEAAATAAHVADGSAAVMKFKSCRWRADPEAGEFCTHRDVLPFAGKTAFTPDSWCPECAFYKLRRTPKKRERVDYSY